MFFVAIVYLFGYKYHSIVELIVLTCYRYHTACNTDVSLMFTRNLDALEFLEDFEEEKKQFERDTLSIMAPS